MKKLIELIQRPKILLRWKLLLGFIAANLVLLVALVVAVAGLFGTTGALERLYQGKERADQFGHLEEAQGDMILQTLDYAWSGNLARLNAYQIASETLDRAIKGFEPTALQKGKFDILVKELEGLRKVLNQIIQLNEANRETDAFTLWQSQGSKAAASVKELINDIDYLEERAGLIEYQNALNQSNSSAMLISGLGVGAFVVAIALALLLTAALTSPVEQLKTRLIKLADGDLTQEVRIVNRDELGTLGNTYNTTLGSLRLLVNQLHVQSQQVSSAAQELGSQVESQVTGSSQQSEAVTEASEALKELNQTAEEIARQTMLASQAAAISLRQAEQVSLVADEMAAAQNQGRETVAHTIEAFMTLKEQMVAIEEQQQVLATQSTSIQEIINLIDSISKETHLLALNAAIEAAGAGAYGERFAVIASEIKRLSDRAVGATSRVRESLGGIALAVQGANQQAEEGRREAERALGEASGVDRVLINLTSLSEQVKAAGHDIVNQVKDTATLTTTIGAVTRQQQVSSHQMLAKMLEIEAITSQNLSSLRQGETVTRQLGQSALQLQRSADTFKLVGSLPVPVSASSPN